VTPPYKLSRGKVARDLRARVFDARALWFARPEPVPGGHGLPGL